MRLRNGLWRWQAAWLCWAMLSGCVQNASSASQGGESVTGGWVYDSSGSCANTLVIREGGRAAWQGVFNLLGRYSVTRVDGSYTGDPVTDGSGSFVTRFTNDRILSPHTLAYCGQWDSGEKTALPFEEVALSGGANPGELSYRLVIAPDGGVAYVGTNENLADLFGIYLDGSGTLHGFSYVDHIEPPATLFHRNQVELISFFSAYPTRQVINLPQQTFRENFSAVPAGEILKTLLLNVNSAVEIVLAANPDGGMPACDFVLYNSPSFLIPRASGQPAPLTQSQSIRFNPGDPAHKFFTTFFSIGGQSGTAYLLPLAVVSADGEECGAAIRAWPLAAVHVKERIDQGGAVDAFSISIGTGPVFMLGNHRAQPSVLLTIPLHAPGPVWEGLVLTPQAVRPPAAASVDLLGLTQPGAVPVSAKLGQDTSGQFLNLFRDETSTAGLGPFQSHAPDSGAFPISLPETLDAPFSANEGKKVFRLTLQQPARVAIASGGGLNTMGRLTGAEGLTLAVDRNGALDGKGFRIVRSLAAGVYHLTVAAPLAGGAFGMTIAEEPASALADENLEACLITAGSVRLANTDIRGLVCVGMGIATLTGIEAFPNLTRFSLADNRIADVSPLRNLDRLHTLYLDGNPVESLAPLLSLTSLYRLSLERIPLPPAALTDLFAFKNRLTFLNLSGATGIDAQDVADLKAAMPSTIIVSITGEILP